MTFSATNEALLNEVRTLEKHYSESNELESLLNDVFSGNDTSIILFLKALTNLSKAQNSPIVEKKTDKIIDLFYKSLGMTKVDSLIKTAKENSNIPLETLQAQLDELIGLENVKKQVSDLIKFNQIQKMRKDSGLKIANKTLHLALLGNPGTAKTTVARIIGKMYKSIGLLSKGHFIEASRTDLIAEYQGQTAIKVKRLVNRARGGVLFIDEAYSITENDHSDAYGRECLTELTKALEDYRDDLVVIVAGYKTPMDKFFDSNPGLKSRFNTFIEFNDYSADELEKILLLMCEKNDYVLEEDAKNSIRKYLEQQIEEKTENFANGRLVRNIFDDLIMNQAIRVSDSGDFSSDSLKTILRTDFIAKDN